MQNGILPQAAFWRGKRVLVTGHTGFKGSWMCLWLRRLGAEVSGFALSAEGAENLFEDCFPSGDPLRGHIGDIRDFASVAKHLNSVQPEIVIHMAAQSLVRRSIANPVDTYATNVMGTAHLLEAIRRTGSVRAVVNVTSDKCYQNNEWHWPYRENDPLGGKDPYSSSKAAAELVGQAFRKTYFAAGSKMLLASARAGNVVGGGDWAEDRLVPDCIRAFRQNAPVVIRNPSSVRPWQHVLEPIAGYLVLAEALYGRKEAFADAWNFGPDPGSAAKVADVVNLLAEQWGGSARADMLKSSDQAEAVLLQVNSSKARALLGWRPRLDLKSTIDWTVDWYKRFSGGAAASTLCAEQIAKYETL